MSLPTEVVGDRAVPGTPAPAPVRGARPVPGAPAGPGGSRVLTRAALASRTAMLALVVAAVAMRISGASWDAVETPLVVAGLVLALPHGAADAAAPWLRGRHVGPAAYAALGLAYLAAAGLTWLACSTWPGFGLLLLLAASVAHFGAGETTFHRLRGAAAGRWTTVSSGLVVVVLPLAAHPAPIARYLAVMVPGWDGLLPAALTTSLILSVLATAAFTGGAEVARGRRGVAVELALLAVAALVAPAVVFLGVYIAAWHSTRHVAVVLHDSQSMASRGHARLLRRAALPAALALGAAAALALTSVHTPLLHYLREEIWLLTALAVPHALAVRWLDVTRDEPAPPRPTPTRT